MEADVGERDYGKVEELRSRDQIYKPGEHDRRVIRYLQECYRQALESANRT